MTLLRESCLYQIWLALLSIYSTSAVHRFLTAAGAWCTHQIDSSLVLSVLCREGLWPGPGRRARCAAASPV